MATINERSEKMRKELVEDILGLMETKGLDWHKDWDARALCPVNGESGRGYHGINRVYLARRAAKAGYSDPRWITFAGAKRAGYHVRKGEKSSCVEYWKPAACIPDPGNPGKLKFLKKRQVEKIDPASVRHVMVLAAIYNVFNYDQLDGAPGYEIENGLIAEWEVADTLIFSSKCQVTECASDRAFYCLRSDCITLPLRGTFVDEESFNATLIHEMAHSTGHRERLNREKEMQGLFGTPQYAEEELRAEFSSVFVQASIGVSLSSRSVNNHAAYLQSWLKACREDEHVLLEAITDAEKIADFLVDGYRAAKAAHHVGVGGETAA